MIPMKDKLTVLAGTLPVKTKRAPFFEENRIHFLATLAEHLRIRYADQPEVVALAFWLRPSHIREVEKRYEERALRRGQGLAFHLAPSNVPMMFVYSFALSFLAGNSNIVRLSARSSEISFSVCETLQEIFSLPEFQELGKENVFLTYERDDEITGKFLEEADLRILWGGDATVTRFQSWPGKPGASQICFPNRNSLALLSQRAVSEMDDEELCIFCRYFFNDTFIMDQNACSSPSGVVWFKDGGDIAARERFWEGLAKIANEEYVPDAYRAARKYETAALVLMDEEAGQETVMRHYGKNALYVLAVPRPVQESLIACLDFHPAFGIFFEWEIESLNALASAVDHRTQTLTCLGPEPKEIANALIQSSCAGIDRIVPVGQALQMGFLWDGKDLLREMSGILTIGEE